MHVLKDYSTNCYLFLHLTYIHNCMLIFFGSWSMYKILGQLMVYSHYSSFIILKEIRLSENPIADPGRGGIPRFVVIARLRKIEILNGSEVKL